MWFIPEDQTTAGACISHLRGRHDYKHREAVAALLDQDVPYQQGRVRQASSKVNVPRELLEEEDEE